jgi:DNA-binding CsgD family transcriptional regulator
MARHVGVTVELASVVREPFEPLPLFRLMGRLHQALAQLWAGWVDHAAALYREVGPAESWSPPELHALHAYAAGMLVAAGLGHLDDVAVILDRLEPFRGYHVVGEGVSYLGPVELTLGRGAVALDRLDAAVDDLDEARERAVQAGARGFLVEAGYHLAAALVARDGPGDLERAGAAAREADVLARSLGMAAYTERTAALVSHLGGQAPAALSPRELEVAKLVAEGLTNRQIADRLVISERTAQNHVQHILTKLGFSTRSQIAAWTAGVRR